jgi:hypothetical protein
MSARVGRSSSGGSRDRPYRRHLFGGRWTIAAKRLRTESGDLTLADNLGHEVNAGRDAQEKRRADALPTPQPTVDLRQE